MLRLLAKSQLTGGQGHAVMRGCLRMYTLQTKLFRWVEQPKKPRISEQLTTMLAQLAGDKGLGESVYHLISFAGQSKAGSTGAAVKREQTMVPKLVGEMEKLELMVVKLTKKTDVDVLRFLKRATNRDFRIKATDVAAALAKRAREEEEEGEEEEEEEEPEDEDEVVEDEGAIADDELSLVKELQQHMDCILGRLLLRYPPASA